MSQKTIHKCLICNATFTKAQGLLRHHSRKTPCSFTEMQTNVTDLQCGDCGRIYTNKGNLNKHIRTSCKKNVVAKDLTLDLIMQEIQQLHQKIDNQTSIAVPITTVNAPVTNINNVNVNVEITPWGSPLALSDADVEAALARLPRLAGTPALGEIVNALMELVKRAHEPASARNIHLS